jgi:GDPmannose 4,6-dehydratase
MLQQDQPEDFVIATGVLNCAAAEMGITLRWQGAGYDGCGYVVEIKGDKIMAVDPLHFRPAKVDTLLGDPSKAREKLGWQATGHHAKGNGSGNDGV